jgi:hypothetical protein
MTWSTIRDGFKARLATIDGLTAHDVMPESLPDKDVAVVLSGEPLFEPQSSSGLISVNVRVVVRCFRGRGTDAQDALDAYLWPSGDNSIIAAVYADATLGGEVDDTEFASVGAHGAVADKPGAFQAEVNFRCAVTPE